jgi:hypothetical protein
MKNLFLITLSLFLTLTSMKANALTCLDKIDTRIQEETEIRKADHIGTGAITVTLLFSYTPVGIALGSLQIADISARLIRKKNLKRVKELIKQSYAYLENGEEGKFLVKTLKKVNRRVEMSISLDEFARDVVYANESLELCRARSLKNYAKRYSIQLEE